VPHSSALLKPSSILSKRERSVYSSANAANAFGMIDSPPELGSELPHPYATGHAIGFRHEQDRDDTVGEQCKKLKTGPNPDLILTKYYPLGLNSNMANSSDASSETEKSKERPLYLLGEKIVTTSTSEDKRTLTCSPDLCDRGRHEGVEGDPIHRSTIARWQDFRFGCSIPVLSSARVFFSEPRRHADLKSRRLPQPEFRPRNRSWSLRMKILSSRSRISRRISALILSILAGSGSSRSMNGQQAARRESLIRPSTNMTH